MTRAEVLADALRAAFRGSPARWPFLEVVPWVPVDPHESVPAGWVEGVLVKGDERWTTPLFVPRGGAPPEEWLWSRDRDPLPDGVRVVAWTPQLAGPPEAWIVSAMVAEAMGEGLDAMARGVAEFAARVLFERGGDNLAAYTSAGRQVDAWSEDEVASAIEERVRQALSPPLGAQE